MRNPALILCLLTVSLTTPASVQPEVLNVEQMHLIEPVSLERLQNEQCGIATYYDYGHLTANGENFNPQELTAAHPSIPFNAWVTVIDQHTGAFVQVRINDRGPWVDEHIIDLTPAGMDAIDPKNISDIRMVCIYWDEVG
ncbi:septal ring lytic transglycosylase RlpA family protein [Egbenema bharatensis]|uniref:septal ring lytic transglycosylase RlpA family protein n=1 Tax=Egbenema bharatensis TaxID=3463334 RepID=UPI003A840F7D